MDSPRSLLSSCIAALSLKNIPVCHALLQTLERSYLLRLNGQIIERPQHMLMRVSVGMHKENLEAAIATYHMMSERWFTHASPTLFNR